MNAISDLNLQYAEMEVNKSPKSTLLKRGRGNLMLSLSNIVLENMNPSSVSTITSLEKDDPSCFPDLISQNVKDYSVKIKILVLGSDGVGKSTLINQVLNKEENKPRLSNALRIKKVTKEIEGKRVKVEFLDTNEKIQKSKVLDSYLKVVDGVLFVLDPARMETVELVLQLSEKAIKFKDEFFIVGNLFSSLRKEEDISAFQNDLKAANDALQELSSRLASTVSFLNLKDKKQDKLLNSFFSRLVSKKKGSKCK